MKTLLRNATMGILCLVATNKLNAQEIWGSVWNYNDSKQSGIWSFTTDPNDNTVTPVHLDPTLVANSGSTWFNNKLYYVSYQIQEGQGYFMYYACNTDNFKPIYSEQVSDAGMMAIASYPDPQTGVNYGCITTSDGYGIEWAKLNYRTFDDRTAIKSLSENLLAVVIDNNGQAYAVNESGEFLKVDKETGEQEVIGQTGVVTSTLSGICVDPETNRIFWAVSPKNEDSGLYEINTQTGKATLIKKFPNNEWFVSLHCTPTPKAKAPAQVTDLTVTPDYAGGGTLKFTAPTTTVDGSTIDEKLTYYIINNADTLHKAKIAAGKTVTWTFDFFKYVWGDQTFIVQTKNSEGMSRQTRLRINIPTEEPTAVEIPKTEKADDESAIFDLNGRKTTVKPGELYIKNGKKFVNK